MYSHCGKFMFCYTVFVIYSGLLSKWPNVEFKALLAIMKGDSSIAWPNNICGSTIKCIAVVIYSGLFSTLPDVEFELGFRCAVAHRKPSVDRSTWGTRRASRLDAFCASIYVTGVQCYQCRRCRPSVAIWFNQYATILKFYECFFLCVYTRPYVDNLTLLN